MISVHVVGGMTTVHVEEPGKHVLDVRQDGGVLVHNSGFSEIRKKCLFSYSILNSFFQIQLSMMNYLSKSNHELLK